MFPLFCLPQVLLLLLLLFLWWLSGHVVLSSQLSLLVNIKNPEQERGKDAQLFTGEGKKNTPIDVLSISALDILFPYKRAAIPLFSFFP